MKHAGLMLTLVTLALGGCAPLTVGPAVLPEVGTGPCEQLPGDTFRHMDSRFAVRCGPQSELPH